MKNLALLPTSYFLNQSRSRKARLYHPSQYLQKPYPLKLALLIGLTLAFLYFSAYRLNGYFSSRQDAARVRLAGQKFSESHTLFEDHLIPHSSFPYFFHQPTPRFPPGGPLLAPTTP